MITIIDYGVGNLFSLKSSFKKIGVDVIVTSDINVIENSEKIVLPGVGAFCDAVNKLRDMNLDKVVINQCEKGKPLLGICLGMQMLFNDSYENGYYTGLGLIPGSVKPLKGVIDPNLKIPQIGWNKLEYKNASPIYKYLDKEEYVYFVHSYMAVDCEKYITATCQYGTTVTASVQKDNVFGCQFHPEKSGEVGLKILKAFCEIK